VINLVIVLSIITVLGYLLSKEIFQELKEENIFLGISIVIVLVILLMSSLNIFFQIHPSQNLLFIIFLVIFLTWLLFRYFRKQKRFFAKL
jgi:membrane protein DedA with SNARE-associated domain